MTGVLFCVCVWCVCACAECGEELSCSDLSDLLHRLPDLRLLQYLLLFLTQVESQHAHNRMTATNLATVFGPSVFQ